MSEEAEVGQLPVVSIYDMYMSEWSEELVDGVRGWSLCKGVTWSSGVTDNHLVDCQL